MLERRVDLITFEKYGEINVDEDPVVFLSCGHFYTISSLDGIMNIKEYYNVDPLTDTIISPKLARRVMSGDTKIHGCPECRMPLRDIHRYNRILKKALLDESTKRFIVKANLTYKGLVGAVQKREIELENEIAEFLHNCSTRVEQTVSSSHAIFPIKRYNKKQKLQRSIDKFTRSMVAAEQPYGRVNDLLASAISREHTINDNAFEADESKIQTGFQIRGQCLQLRLTWAFLWNYAQIYTNPNVDLLMRSELCDVVANQIEGLSKDCCSIRDASRAAKLLPQQVEAMVHYALFSTLHLSNSEVKGQRLGVDAVTELRQQVSVSLEECEALCSSNPGTLGFLKDDIEKAKRLSNGGTFYSFVTTEEKQQVYEAMASQFSGTGHWYYCQNNHPVKLPHSRLNY